MAQLLPTCSCLIKVANFGLPPLLASPSADPSFTLAPHAAPAQPLASAIQSGVGGAAGGLPVEAFYSAPELLESDAQGWRNDQDADEACDAYAFGVLMWELLMGSPPYVRFLLACHSHIGMLYCAYLWIE